MKNASEGVGRNVKDSLILALDFPNKEEVHTFLTPFGNEKLFVKVGMELFYKEGPRMIEEIKSMGHHIFLDLKLHDIPVTVKRAMSSLASLEVDLVNVHALGGKAMMEGALEGLEAGTRSGKARPKCIAVTQLTSSTDEMVRAEQLGSVSLQQSVEHLAGLTNEAGLDGVVCSVHEVERIRELVRSDFLTVTPGIRLLGDNAHDQHRVATPAIAREKGSNFIVVGRSITRAENPVEAYGKVQKEWRGITS